MLIVSDSRSSKVTSHAMVELLRGRRRCPVPREWLIIEDSGKTTFKLVVLDSPREDGVCLVARADAFMCLARLFWGHWCSHSFQSTVVFS